MVLVLVIGFRFKHMLAKTYDLPVSIALQMFDKKVLPILLYGAELWGDGPNVSRTKNYNNFHKYLLGLPIQSFNRVALGELGMPSFKCHSYYWLICGWLRFFAIKHSFNLLKMMKNLWGLVMF